MRFQNMDPEGGPLLSETDLARAPSTVQRLTMRRAEQLLSALLQHGGQQEQMGGSRAGLEAGFRALDPSILIAACGPNTAACSSQFWYLTSFSL